MEQPCDGIRGPLPSVNTHTVLPAALQARKRSQAQAHAMRPTVPVPAAGRAPEPSNSRTRTASGGWEAPEIEYALALAVVRWELPDDACPVALFNSVLNYSLFDFFQL